MSVLCTLVRVPERQLETALADPDVAEALFVALDGGEDGDTDPPFAWTDIDGSFDAIHFVLDPARRSAEMGEPTDGLGGRLIYGTHARPDVWAEFYEGYGVEGYSRPEEVRALVSEMGAVDFESALAGAAPALAKRGAVYRGGTEPGYVRSHYATLREFYEAAAAAGEAVVTFVM